MAEYDEAGNCCGLKILTAFGAAATEFQNLPSYKGEDDDYPDGDLSSLIVLNGQQKRNGHEHLVRQGYVLLRKFFNPRHSSVLYLYFREAYPTYSPGDRRFNRKRYRVAERPGGYEVVLNRKTGMEAQPKAYDEPEEVW